MTTTNMFLISYDYNTNVKVHHDNESKVVPTMYGQEQQLSVQKKAYSPYNFLKSQDTKDTQKDYSVKRVEGYEAPNADSPKQVELAHKSDDLCLFIGSILVTNATNVDPASHISETSARILNFAIKKQQGSNNRNAKQKLPNVVDNLSINNLNEERNSHGINNQEIDRISSFPENNLKATASYVVNEKIEEFTPGYLKYSEPYPVHESLSGSKFISTGGEWISYQPANSEYKTQNVDYEQKISVIKPTVETYDYNTNAKVHHDNEGKVVPTMYEQEQQLSVQKKAYSPYNFLKSQNTEDTQKDYSVKGVEDYEAPNADSSKQVELAHKSDDVSYHTQLPTSYQSVKLSTDIGNGYETKLVHPPINTDNFKPSTLNSITNLHTYSSGSNKQHSQGNENSLFGTSSYNGPNENQNTLTLQANKDFDNKGSNIVPSYIKDTKKSKDKVLPSNTYQSGYSIDLTNYQTVNENTETIQPLLGEKYKNVNDPSIHTNYQKKPTIAPISHVAYGSQNGYENQQIITSSHDAFNHKDVHDTFNHKDLHDSWNYQNINKYEQTTKEVPFSYEGANDYQDNTTPTSHGILNNEDQYHGINYDKVYGTQQTISPTSHPIGLNIKTEVPILLPTVNPYDLANNLNSYEIQPIVQPTPHQLPNDKGLYDSSVKPYGNIDTANNEYKYGSQSLVFPTAHQVQGIYDSSYQNFNNQQYHAKTVVPSTSQSPNNLEGNTKPISHEILKIENQNLYQNGYESHQSFLPTQQIGLDDPLKYQSSYGSNYKINDVLPVVSSYETINNYKDKTNKIQPTSHVVQSDVINGWENQLLASQNNLNDPTKYYSSYGNQDSSLQKDTKLKQFIPISQELLKNEGHNYLSSYQNGNEHTKTSVPSSYLTFKSTTNNHNSAKHPNQLKDNSLQNIGHQISTSLLNVNQHSNTPKKSQQKPEEANYYQLPVHGTFSDTPKSIPYSNNLNNEQQIDKQKQYPKIEFVNDYPVYNALTGSPDVYDKTNQFLNTQNINDVPTYSPIAATTDVNDKTKQFSNSQNDFATYSAVVSPPEFNDKIKQFPNTQTVNDFPTYSALVSPPEDNDKIKQFSNTQIINDIPIKTNQFLNYQSINDVPTYSPLVSLPQVNQQFSNTQKTNDIPTYNALSSTTDNKIKSFSNTQIINEVPTYSTLVTLPIVNDKTKPYSNTQNIKDFPNYSILNSPSNGNNKIKHFSTSQVVNDIPKYSALISSQEVKDKTKGYRYTRVNNKIPINNVLNPPTEVKHNIKQLSNTQVNKEIPIYSGFPSIEFNNKIKQFSSTHVGSEHFNHAPAYSPLIASTGINDATNKFVHPHNVKHSPRTVNGSSQNHIKYLEAVRAIIEGNTNSNIKFNQHTSSENKFHHGNANYKNVGAQKSHNQETGPSTGNKNGVNGESHRGQSGRSRKPENIQYNVDNKFHGDVHVHKSNNGGPHKHQNAQHRPTIVNNHNNNGFHRGNIEESYTHQKTHYSLPLGINHENVDFHRSNNIGSHKHPNNEHSQNNKFKPPYNTEHILSLDNKFNNNHNNGHVYKSIGSQNHQHNKVNHNTHSFTNDYKRISTTQGFTTNTGVHQFNVDSKNVLKSTFNPSVHTPTVHKSPTHSLLNDNSSKQRSEIHKIKEVPDFHSNVYKFGYEDVMGYNKNDGQAAPTLSHHFDFNNKANVHDAEKHTKSGDAIKYTKISL